MVKYNVVFAGVSILSLSVMVAAADVTLIMSRDVKKPVFGVSDQVRHKPACTSSEKN